MVKEMITALEGPGGNRLRGPEVARRAGCASITKGQILHDQFPDYDRGRSPGI